MRSKKWVWILVMVLLVAFFWWWKSGDEKRVSHRDDPSLIRDRTWVDSKPTKYTDYVHAFIALGYVPIGYFIKASAYDVRLERFDYSGKGGKLRVIFPQSGKDAELSYQVTECNELPPFDLCLDLSDNPWGGPKRYYGMRDADAEEKHLGTLRRRMLAELPQ